MGPRPVMGPANLLRALSGLTRPIRPDMGPPRHRMGPLRPDMDPLRPCIAPSCLVRAQPDLVWAPQVWYGHSQARRMYPSGLTWVLSGLNGPLKPGKGPPRHGMGPSGLIWALKGHVWPPTPVWTLSGLTWSPSDLVGGALPGLVWAPQA